ncbi:MAG: nicotinate phosphoribosyltransferase [Acidimicrobiia bacterium]|nr:MAG: nicotinate phosphoribosyltransferase [Acidimicrobiia bacterium]
MARLYFEEGLHETQALFEHSFRTHPDYGTHQAGYCIHAGVADLLDWMARFAFTPRDLEYLATLTDPGGRRLFDSAFLNWLGGIDLDGVMLSTVPEGRVVHAGVTLTMVEGPLAVAQIMETALLNRLAYPTLIATKASLVAESARGRPVFEFGVRRGPSDGAAAGTRAALIGGATSTSFVGAARDAGVAPSGTHAHSMVQVSMALGLGEVEAFRAYSRLYPDSCLLLVDTVDTLESGVPNAIRVFQELRAAGHEPVGIRLDSGDLAHLAVRSARMLDDAGFGDTTIVLSGGLDELAIWQIMTQIEQEAGSYGMEPEALIARLAFGVGTSLITSQGAPSLDAVYKLVALRRDGAWLPAVKVSETPRKTVIPGRKQVVRIYDGRGRATADVMALEDEDLSAAATIELRHLHEQDVMRVLSRNEIGKIERLPVLAWAEGRRVMAPEPIEVLRRRRNDDLERLDPGVRRMMHPHIHHVSLTRALWDLRQQTVAAALGATPPD